MTARFEIDGRSYTVAEVVRMLDESIRKAPSPYLRAQKVVDAYWDPVAADTRQRVVRRVGGTGRVVFDLYAAAAADVLRSRRSQAMTA